VGAQLGADLDDTLGGRTAPPGVAADDGVQRHLVEDEPQQFFRPPYVGVRGWVGMWLDDDPDWDRVELLVEEAWRCIAGSRLIKDWVARR